MRIKIALFVAPLICIYCTTSYSMGQINLSGDQIHILFTCMRDNPASFNSLTREIAHTMYKRNPTIKRSVLRAFFRDRDNDKIDNAILPREIINRIWQFIVDERSGKIGAENIRLFVTHGCDGFGIMPSNPAGIFATLEDGFTYSKDPFPGQEVQTNYFKAAYCHCLHFVNQFRGNNDGSYTLQSITSLKDGDMFQMVRPLEILSTSQLAHTFIHRLDISVSKQVHLLYGTSRAILIIVDKANIFVVPNIPYIHRVTTGQQLIKNIYQACNYCKQFTDWGQVHSLFERLDLSQY